MCETKTVLLVAALQSAAAGFYTYQVNSETKVGQHSETKSESPCEKEYKKCCLNGGEFYYLADEDKVGCNCTCLFGGKRCEKYMWWTLVNCLKSDAL